ncbi:hypothetical protein RJ639_013989 [Escallonia herrerae]|uniref:Uncharacterized protein n=1 Tax=Escallonia herrerae TaxID=1293975 RepID=A0AA89AMN6_9ASTE|nr:hypothetical protein RJ639_013989 [Escallonia herrerae]
MLWDQMNPLADIPATCLLHSSTEQAYTNECNHIAKGHDNKVDIPYAVSGQELHRYFGSSFLTTGKGNFNLANSNLRPVEPSCAA